MHRRFNPGQIQLTDLLHIADNRLQLLLEYSLFIRRQLQTSQFGNVCDINCMTHPKLLIQRA